MKGNPLRIILLVAFVDLVGFGLIIPLQATYAERFGASGLTFGLLIGVYAAMQFVFNPILGRWSDRVGRRRVLLLSVGGSVLSHALLGASDLVGSLPLLFVARTLDGITGANIATAQAYIADVTTPENRARGMGLFGAAFGLGFVLGPALGAGLAAVGWILSGPYGSAWPAFGAAAISLTALILVWALLPESRPARPTATARTRFALEGLTRLSHYVRLRELFTLMFGATFAFVLLEATFVYLCARRFGLAEAGMGLLFAYIGLIMVIVQGGLIGKLVRRFGEPRLVTVAPFITAAGFVVISGVPLAQSSSLAWTLLMVGCVFTAGGHGLTGPSVSALVSRQAAVHRQGVTLGISQGIGSLARAVGPPIGGILFDVGPPWPYWIGAILLVILGVYAASVRSAQERSLQEAAAPADQ